MEDKIELAPKESGLKPLTDVQRRLVMMSRSRYQFLHSPAYRGDLPQDTETYELGKKHGIKVRSAELIGWDEQERKFTVGHDTEDHRRIRGGRQLVSRGRGSYCILDDEKNGEAIFVLTLDNPDDGEFISEHKEELFNSFPYSFKSKDSIKTRAVILLGDKQISVPGITDRKFGD